MISMATPSIISAISGNELSMFAIIFLLLLVSAAGILYGDYDIKKRFTPFIDICNTNIVPLLSIFILIIITRVIMVL